MDVAVETEAGELIEQVPLESVGAGKPVDLFGAEAEGFQEIERLFEAGGHQEAAARRQFADEELEHRGFGVAMIQIGLDHVEMIEVGEQRAGRRIHRVARRAKDRILKSRDFPLIQPALAQTRRRR